LGGLSCLLACSFPQRERSQFGWAALLPRFLELTFSAATFLSIFLLPLTLSLISVSNPRVTTIFPLILDVMGQTASTTDNHSITALTSNLAIYPQPSLYSTYHLVSLSL
jgi:hypothetical protein